MYAFLKLREELMKGITDKDSNVLITNWSPNNIKSLIIGFDYIIVGYHIKTSKNKYLFSIIDVRKERGEDFNLLQNGKKVVGVLKALFSLRVCSCLEEVIFCAQGYDSYLAHIDMDMECLIKDAMFGRLRYTAKTVISVSDLYNLIGQGYTSMDSLVEYLSRKGVSFSDLREYNKDKWWHFYYLRPTYYALDSEECKTGLYPYFKKIEQSIDSAHVNAYKELRTQEKVQKEFNKFDKDFLTLLNNIPKMKKDFINSLSVEDKCLWCVKMTNYTVKGLNVEYKKFNEYGIENCNLWFKFFSNIGVGDCNSCDFLTVSKLLLEHLESYINAEYYYFVSCLINYISHVNEGIIKGKANLFMSMISDRVFLESNLNSSKLALTELGREKKSIILNYLRDIKCSVPLASDDKASLHKKLLTIKTISDGLIKI